MAEFLSLKEAISKHIFHGDTVAMEGLPTSSRSQLGMKSSVRKKGFNVNSYDA